MQTWLIVGAITLVSLLFIAMIVVQGQHRSAVKKKTELHHLSLLNKKLNSALKTLPVEYVKAELREFIYQSLFNNLRRMISLKPSNQAFLHNDLLQLEADYAAIKDKPDLRSAARPVIDINQSNLIRSHLKGLHQYVQTVYSNKKLSAAHAEKILQLIEATLIEVTLDFLIHQGEASFQKGHFREARNSYNKAREAIEKSKHREQFKTELLTCITKVKVIQTAWREYNNAQRQTESLADSLDEYNEEMDSWKKKADYD